MENLNINKEKLQSEYDQLKLDSEKLENKILKMKLKHEEMESQLKLEIENNEKLKEQMSNMCVNKEGDEDGVQLIEANKKLKDNESLVRSYIFYMCVLFTLFFVC